MADCSQAVVTGPDDRWRTAGWRSVGWRAVGLLVIAGAGAVLVQRAAVGARVTATLGAGAPGPGIGPWWAATAGMIVLAGTGALPAWRLVGRRPLAVFLAPCVGAVVAAVSAAVTTAAASEPLRWFVAFAAAINAAALAAVAAGREGHAGGEGPARRKRVVPGGLPAGLLVLGVCGFGASALGRLGPTPAAAGTWLALAALLVHGHHAVHPALVVSAVRGAHLVASPLASGSAAVTWLVTGTRSVAAASSVVALVTVSAIGAATCAVAEIGWAVPGRRLPGSGHVTSATALTALVGAACFGLAAFGVSGAAVFDGSLTPLWSAGAAGAAVLGLVMAPTGWRLRGALVLGAVAALTAPEGAIVGLGLVVLVTLRRAAIHRRTGGVAGRVADVAGGLVAAAAVLAWPVVAVVAGAGPVRLGLPSALLAGRLDGAWRAMAAGLLPAAVAGVVAAVSGVVLGRERRRQGLGSDAGVAATALLGLGLALVVAGWDVPTVRAWFTEAAASAVVLPALLAVAAMVAWAVTGMQVVLGRSGPVGAADVVGPGSPGSPAATGMSGGAAGWGATMAPPARPAAGLSLGPDGGGTPSAPDGPAFRPADGGGAPSAPPEPVLRPAAGGGRAPMASMAVAPVWPAARVDGLAPGVLHPRA